jgi:hypothetical protein
MYYFTGKNGTTKINLILHRKINSKNNQRRFCILYFIHKINFQKKNKQTQTNITN